MKLSSTYRGYTIKYIKPADIECLAYVLKNMRERCFNDRDIQEDGTVYSGESFIAVLSVEERDSLFKFIDALNAQL